MRCLFMDKINYQNIAKEELSKIDKNNKPNLLLHACCGPCSAYPLTLLCEYFNVTIYFNNSNIYPSEEYYRRLFELKRFLENFEKDYNHHVNLITTPYDNENYNKILEPLKDEPECGKRCVLCYTKRMKEAYDYAEENKFDYFTTVMTISRQKSSQVLNQIGNKLEKDHKFTKYFYSDFKKENGILKGKALRDKYSLYQQTYCGCYISYNKRLEWDLTHKNK